MQTLHSGLRDRRGFTFVETLLVMVVLAILVSIGVPRLANARTHGSVRTATQKVQAYMLTARLAAIRRGRPTTFHAAGNNMWITSQSPAGVVDTVGRAIDLDAVHGVTLTAGASAVRFDSRGFTDLTGSRTFRVSRAGHADSICVSRAGVVGRCGF